MDTKTLRCGLLGRKLGHSYSPAIHERLADYSYRLFEVEPEDLGAFLQEGAFDGLNVTIPYKKDVIPYCAELSDTARAIGAVNTLVRRADGTLWGDNTDAYGFSMLVQSSGADVAGKKALVFGSGGASATAQYVLRQLGAREVVVISRHGEDNYENLDRHADAQIAVNTTPVGMYPNIGVSPVDLSRFPKLEAALDVVYNPARTEFLLQAEARGLRRANGLLMLAAQAKKSCEDFTGEPVDDAKIFSITKALEAQMHNVILIGMPGSGKTTIVKLLLGFYNPNKGDVRIGDTSLRNLNPHVWRSKTGSVMQDGFIFSDTIANNIAPGEEVVDKERLLHAVTVANIRDFIDSLPLGYNTKIGMEGNGVSQGQRQRILIARAVYKNPDFIFLDEATNALDANNEREIMEQLHAFYKGRTVVVVAHRLSTVRDADKIVVLDKGRIVEEGTHQELTALRGTYYKLVKNQLELGN